MTYLGEENIDNIATAKLQLIPKSEKVRNYFSKAFLWIDLNRGISVQQQFDARPGRLSPGEVFCNPGTGKDRQ